MNTEKKVNTFKQKFVNVLSGLNPKLTTYSNALEENEIVNIKNLNCFFKTTNGILHAVRGIDLKLKKGEIIGVVGESGSGKSVTVKSLIGFNENCKVSADQLNFNELELTSLNDNSWKKIRGNQIGYIPQDPLTSLNPVHTIGSQLKEAYYLGQKRKFQWRKAMLKQEVLTAKFNKDPNYDQIVAKNKTLLAEYKKQYKELTHKDVVKKKIYDILKFIGIQKVGTALKTYPHQFSGGMRQRIVIAMVLLGEPKLIIADEPTTALDVIVQAKVLDLLKQINQKYNITIIMISHNIGMIANFCNYIYVLYAGEIVEKGTVYDLFTNPRHPYTWALITAIPDSSSTTELASIPGTPPNLLFSPVGDAFAPRNKYAMEIDFEQKPPMFQISPTHYAATWLLHEDNPHKIDLPQEVVDKLKTCHQAVLNKAKMLNQIEDLKNQEQKTERKE